MARMMASLLKIGKEFRYLKDCYVQPTGEQLRGNDKATIFPVAKFSTNRFTAGRTYPASKVQETTIKILEDDSGRCGWWPRSGFEKIGN